MENIQPGQELGPYRIIGQIGQGGMATVYKAYHAAMDRYVAVKVLPHQLAESPEFTGRFQLEARTIARLEHARILPVYDSGTSGGVPYLVMRYLDAGTLKDRMQAGPLALPEVDRLFTQLAEALEYAHRQGVVHRDLKPSNVMVDAPGNLYLTDFGIAKLLEGGAHFTSTGAMMGTPAYMSPEQAQGDKVDQRTDIYSLGIILYEMVTGRVPFEAETPLAVVLKQINAPLPPPTSLKPDLAPAVERVLLKALAKDPADRFASVADFLAAWKQALAQADTLHTAAPATLAGEAAPAPVVEPPPAPAAAPPPARPFPLGLVAGGLALVVVIGLAVVFAPRLLAPAPTAAPTEPAAAQPTRAPSAVPPTEAAPGATAPAAPTPAPTTVTAAAEARSWTSVNRVRMLVVHQGELYAAGPGGITVWDIASGSIARRYTTADGLPHANVFAISVDDDGTLWAATEGGLGRLNPGRTDWITYDTADGLDSDTATAVLRAGDYLLVGTQYSDRAGGGLNAFDGQQWEAAPDFPSVPSSQTPASGQVSDQVTALLAAGGQLWVGTEAGLARHDGSAWTTFTTADGLPSDRIQALATDPAGDIFVGTDAGAARFDGQVFVKAEQAPAASVYGLVTDSQGRYYLSGDGGIWRYDPANANWDEFSTANGALSVYSITGAAAGPDGALFFGSDGVGPIYYDGQTFTPWYTDDATVRTWFRRIRLAPDGRELWFAELYGTYVDRFDLAAQAWRPYVDPPCDCELLAVSAQGEVWGAQYDAGVWVVSADGRTKTQLDKATAGLPSNTVTAVAFDDVDGHFLLGTDAGVVHLDDQKHLVEVFNIDTAGLLSNDVTALLTTADPPATWVGTPLGVSHLKPDFTWEHFPVGAPFGSGLSYISALAEGPGGVIWAAADGAGLYRYADGQWQGFQPGQSGVGLPEAHLNSLTVAPDGAVWVGTSRGAVRYDGQSWRVLTTKDGLISNEVNDIYFDAAGAAWFATSSGVTRLQP